MAKLDGDLDPLWHDLDWYVSSTIPPCLGHSADMFPQGHWPDADYGMGWY